MSDTVWAFILLGVAFACLVAFVYHDVSLNRRLDDDFRREIEELRQQYGNDE